MADTLIIDAAIRAGCMTIGTVGCVHPACLGSAGLCAAAKAIPDALRVALPWEPPPERLKATINAGCIGGRANCRYPSCGCETYPETVIAAYRNQPIMRELYPEQFRATEGEE